MALGNITPAMKLAETDNLNSLLQTPSKFGGLHLNKAQ